MAQLDTNLSDTITINKKTGTVVTLDTDKKYVEKDIALTFNVKTGSVSLAADAITTNPTLSFSNNQLVASYSDSTTVTPTVTAGWVASVNSINVSASGENKVSSLTIPKGNSFSIITEANSSADTSVLTITNGAKRNIALTNNGSITSLTNSGTIVELINNSGASVNSIQNSGTVTVTSGSSTAGILSVKAYNGSTLTASQIIVRNGAWYSPTVYGPGTYYGKVMVPLGVYDASVVEHSITTPPEVSGALSGQINAISTATKPNGTDGTDYWSITPSTVLVTVGQSSSKGKATISSAGYTSGQKTSTAHVVNITPTMTNGATKYLVKAVGSITMTAGNGTCSYDSATNATVSNSITDPGSGVSVTFKGKGAVSATAATTAGYTPTNNSFATGASTNSNEASLTKYITGVTLQKSTSNRTFDITVPNGSSTVKFTFTVDTNGNVLVT